MNETEVTFEVEGDLYSIGETGATIMAEDLRRMAAGQLGDYGVEGARAVADVIEDVLTGSRESAIPLEGHAAESVFYYLNGGLGSDRSDPARALYIAVRELHQRAIASQGSSSGS